MQSRSFQMLYVDILVDIAIGMSTIDLRTSCIVGKEQENKKPRQIIAKIQVTRGPTSNRPFSLAMVITSSCLGSSGNRKSRLVG